MASNFVIFEDQENFNEEKVVDYAELKRERTKLAPLTNKAGSNENAAEKQVRNKSMFFLPALYLIFDFIYILDFLTNIRP